VEVEGTDADDVMDGEDNNDDDVDNGDMDINDDPMTMIINNVSQ
jgi:hypothetical protein